MKKAIEWMVDNHVTVNLIMLLIVFSGIVASFKINKEIFPQIDPGIISVQVVYPGATPEDIENSIVDKIEESISNISGIEQITSASSENAGMVNIEIKSGENIYKIKDEIETQINSIKTFPKDSEKPTITILEAKSSVIQIGISGNMNYDEMNKLSKKIKDDLIAIDGISQIYVSGLKNYEIIIEINEDALNKYDLKISDISNAVKAENLDMPAGKIKRKNDEILLRTQGLRYNAEDYENIVIKINPNGAILRLKDIAKVKDGYEESDLYSYFNSKPAVMLNVYRIGDESALDIAEKVNLYINSVKHDLPQGIKITTWKNNATLLKERLSLMLRNAAMGFILVLITLTLFLDLRLALWVSSGIIISFLGVFIVMHILGVTINLISLFAFILVLGIVVDDAIVIGEEIYSNREKGMSPKDASKTGAKRIAVPVIFSVLTTVATFSPLLFVDGRMGDVLYAIPVIVIAILLISLFESIFILPAHLSTIKMKSDFWLTKISAWITQKVDNGLKLFINKILEPSVIFSLKYRYMVLASFMTILLVSMGLMAGGVVKFDFFPDVEGDNAIVYVTMPKGSTLSYTKSIIDKIEQRAYETINELERKYPEYKGKILKNIYITIGSQPDINSRHSGGNKISVADPSKAEISVELLSSENRKFKTKEFIKIWKDKVGNLAGPENIQYQSILMSVGDAVALNVSGKNFKSLKSAVNDLKNKLATYDGIYNVKDDFQEGKLEIKFSLKPKASALGIRLIDIASQIRNSFFGDEVMRIQRGSYEVKVRIRYPENSRKTINDITKMKIKTRTGAQIPITEVVNFKYGRAYSTISHADLKRTIRVSASLEENTNTSTDINKNLKTYIDKELKNKYPDVSFSFEGSNKQRKKSMGSLLSGFIIAIFIVYMLLAIPFKSYIQPFIIMLSIPFGMIGAIWAHYFLGLKFTFMSSIGVVALSGVVVNDALVLVDYINELFNNNKAENKEESRNELVKKAVSRRFRPILLTSVTTFFGLVPMIFEKSIQAQFLIPMAVSLGFGIIFATFITIYLIPLSVLIVEDLKSLFSGAKND